MRAWTERSKDRPVVGRLASAAATATAAFLILGVSIGGCAGAKSSSQRPESTSARTPNPIVTASTAGPTPATATTPPPPTPAAAVPANALVPLTIAEPTHAGTYKRSFFGGWERLPHSCEDTRAEVLISESAVPVELRQGTCTVASGKWTDPWSGKVTTDAHALDVDHMVPLENAWQSGAWAWDSARLHAYANNLLFADHLIAILLSENRSKGDEGPDQWKPPARSSWCHYAIAWDRIKAAWGLTVTSTEWSALVAMATTC